MKAVIFDFNRTLFDPETASLVKDTELVLQNLIKQGFTLFLISRGGQGRKNLIKRMKIGEYFKGILVKREKTLNDFKELVEREGISPEISFVVGDQTRKEISFGNTLGLRTIWVRSGKFSDILPASSRENPSVTISKLGEALSVIKRHS